MYVQNIRATYPLLSSGKGDVFHTISLVCVYHNEVTHTARRLPATTKAAMTRVSTATL